MSLAERLSVEITYQIKKNNKTRTKINFVDVLSWRFYLSGLMFLSVELYWTQKNVYYLLLLLKVMYIRTFLSPYGVTYFLF